MEAKTGLIGRIKAKVGSLASPPNRGGGGFWGTILEAMPGNWQKNIEIDTNCVTRFGAVFSCVTLIASDVAKLRIKLIENKDGAWVETTNTAYSGVLKRPNKNQSRIQFLEAWVLSKLLHGNTYVLKVRDGKGAVNGFKVLDPQLVQPLISPDGSVWYQIQADNFNGIEDPPEAFPQSEIIHDRYNCLFHPLVGLSPLYAASLAAMQGWHIQQSQTKLFAAGVQAPGILTAPGAISDEAAARLKETWETKYANGNGYGKIAVLGDGLEFKGMTATAADSKLIEQLDWTALQICGTFHVPPYMIGIGTPPPYTDIQSVNQQYYSQALQHLIEAIELLMDEGLSLSDKLGVELDVANLLRMDARTQSEVLSSYAKIGALKLDEIRAEIGREKMKGGDAAYIQQQNFSVEALAKRDSTDDPFATRTTQNNNNRNENVNNQPPPAPATDESANAAKYFALISKRMEGFSFEL